MNKIQALSASDRVQALREKAKDMKAVDIEAMTESFATIPWYQDLYYGIHRAFRKPFAWRDIAVAFWERGVRGYAVRDTWNLNSHLAKVMVGSIDELLENGYGYPGVEGAETFEKWQQILREIQDGFRATIQLETLPYKDKKVYQAASKRLMAKQKKGLLLFQRWFNSLGD